MNDLQPLYNLIASSSLPSLRSVFLDGYLLLIGDTKGQVHIFDLGPMHREVKPVEDNNRPGGAGRTMSEGAVEVIEQVGADVREVRCQAVHGDNVLCLWTDGEILVTGGRDQR